MRILYDPKSEGNHSCKKEIGWDSSGSVDKIDYPRAGMILECSCGKLWTTQEYGSTYWLHITKATRAQKRMLKKKVAP